MVQLTRQPMMRSAWSSIHLHIAVSVPSRSTCGISPALRLCQATSRTDPLTTLSFDPRLIVS